MSLTQTYFFTFQHTLIFIMHCGEGPCIESSLCFSEERYLFSSKNKHITAARLILYVGHKIEKFDSSALALL